MTEVSDVLASDGLGRPIRAGDHLAWAEHHGHGRSGITYRLVEVLSARGSGLRVRFVRDGGYRRPVGTEANVGSQGLHRVVVVPKEAQ